MRQTGTVKFFNQAKGFGFITPDEGGKDVFVHISAVERSGVGMLDEGMRVTYETQPDPKGKRPEGGESRTLGVGRDPVRRTPGKRTKTAQAFKDLLASERNSP